MKNDDGSKRENRIKKLTNEPVYPLLVREDKNQTPWISVRHLRGCRILLREPLMTDSCMPFSPMRSKAEG